MAQPELQCVLNRRRQEVETKGSSYTKDRAGRADAVWYEHSEGQFSPRATRQVSRLASAQAAPAAPARALARVRRSFPAAVRARKESPKESPDRFQVTAAPKRRKEVARSASSSSASTISCEASPPPKASPKRAAAKCKGGKTGKSPERKGAAVKGKGGTPGKSLEAKASGPAPEPQAAVDEPHPEGTPGEEETTLEPEEVEPCEQEGHLELGEGKRVKLSTVESCDEREGGMDGSKSEGETPSPRRSVATGASSWRQLSLDSLSSGGLPTILARVSDGKKGLEQSPCTEPEPAPSPTKPGDVTAPLAGPASGREYRQLWEAVIQGDLKTLKELLDQGLLSGNLIDMNGHSIFWNALAYQQHEVANFLLHHFPPGQPKGVDLLEVHARRKDTLLHLCVFFQYFSAAVAHLFQTLFQGMGKMAKPMEVWGRMNSELQNVALCAAERKNFWVLRFLACHAPKLLQEGRPTALEVLLQRLEEVGVTSPTPAVPEKEVSQAGCLDFTRYLAAQQEAVFADVELEISEATGRYRVPAHRCVLGAASGVLHRQLLGCSGRLRIESKSCCNRQVLHCALSFIYSGRISCDFSEEPSLLWQLLCLCATYRLPEPLWRFARLSVLRASDPAIQPLMVEGAADLGLSSSETLYVAQSFLRSPEATAEPEAILLAFAVLEQEAMSMLVPTSS